MAEPRRRLSPNVVAGLVLLVLLAAVLLWQRPWQGGDGPARPVPLPDDAAAVLTDQAARISAATSADELAEAFGHGHAARRLGEQVWQARELLGVEDVRWRYLSGGDVAVHDDGDARADVEVEWTGGQARVRLRVEPRDGRAFDVVDISGVAGDELPIWLAGRLTAEADGDVEVLRIDGGDRVTDVETMAQRALRVVRSAVRDVEGRLVVVSPPTAAVAADLLGGGADGLRQIAAVAAAREDREGRLPGRVVVLNPDQFADMDERAAQIVLSHEAAHVLVGGIGSQAETWVVEGFADFVALHDDTAALTVSAGQILAEVERTGPPSRLPTPADFTSSAHGLGAVYESAWLAFRMLAERHGDAAVIEFYRAVIGGVPVDRAARTTFGLSVDEVTQQWRRYLQDLARDPR